MVEGISRKFAPDIQRINLQEATGSVAKSETTLPQQAMSQIGPINNPVTQVADFKDTLVASIVAEVTSQRAAGKSFKGEEVLVLLKNKIATNLAYCSQQDQDYMDYKIRKDLRKVVPDINNIPGQLIVTYKKLGDAQNQNNVPLKTSTNTLSVPTTNNDSQGIVLLNVDPANTHAILNELLKEPTVAYVEPDSYVYLEDVASTSLQGEQVALQTMSTTTTISKPDNFIIAVLDSGIDLAQPLLSNYLWTNTKETPDDGIDNDGNGIIDDVHGANFIDGRLTIQDDLGHGTIVSSAVTGVADKQVGYGRINFHPQIMPLKVFDALGRSSLSIISKALLYAAANGAQVVNCSFGYDQAAAFMTQTVADVTAKGVKIAASSGNQGSEKIVYPAGYAERPEFKDNVFAISAITLNGDLANFSNYGGHISFTEPGTGIKSLSLGGQYVSASGTSLSAPLAARFLGYYMYTSSLADNALMKQIQDQAKDLGDSGWDNKFGYGEINPLNILNDPQPVPIPFGLEKVINVPNPAKESTQFFFLLKGSQADIQINIYNKEGRVVNILNFPAQTNNGDSFNNFNDADFPQSSMPSWDLRDMYGARLPNGAYFYTITARANGQSVTKSGKMAILK